jgi:hypothetical protein
MEPLGSARPRCRAPSALPKPFVPMHVIWTPLPAVAAPRPRPPMRGCARAPPWLPAGPARQGQASGARPGAAASSYAKALQPCQKCPPQRQSTPHACQASHARPQDWLRLEWASGKSGSNLGVLGAQLCSLQASMAEMVHMAMSSFINVPGCVPTFILAYTQTGDHEQRCAQTWICQV